MKPTGVDRAFRRGVRIAAAFAAAIVVIFMIDIVNRDHPLKWQPHPMTPSVTDVKGATGTSGDPSGILAHPPKSTSELGAK